MTNINIESISDRELLDQLANAVADERNATAAVVVLLAEVDVRRLYLPEGFSSLFSYCTGVLKLTEQESYRRISAARAARKYPVLIKRLCDGSLTLTSVTMLAGHITPENAEMLIGAALNKSTRALDELLAAIDPKPDVCSSVRKLPESMAVSANLLLSHDEGPATRTTETPASLILPQSGESMRSNRPPSSPRSVSAPLSADRYLLRVTLSAEAHAMLRRAQDLLRHSVGNPDPAVIVERALSVLLRDLERQRMARAVNPRPQVRTSADHSSGEGAGRAVNARYIPAAIRREVWRRDSGRCTFVGSQGRCGQTGKLEIHHVHAFALGGPSTAANLALRCRAHNQYEGELLFGPERRKSRKRDETLRAHS